MATLPASSGAYSSPPPITGFEATTFFADAEDTLNDANAEGILDPECEAIVVDLPMASQSAMAWEVSSDKSAEDTSGADDIAPPANAIAAAKTTNAMAIAKITNAMCQAHQWYCQSAGI